MKWFKRILRSKTRYSDGKFSLHLVPVFRECLRVRYSRGLIWHDLSAEYVGRRRAALDIRIPSDLPTDQLGQLIGDLEVGLQAMGKEYVIAQAERPTEVPQDEQERATSRLRQMGFQPEVIDNRVTLKPLEPGTKSYSPDNSLEIMTLVQAVHGRRTPIRELAPQQGL